MHVKPYVIAIIVVLSCLALGCAERGLRVFPQQPDAWLAVGGFKLALFNNEAKQGSLLHIYLDGDGRPLVGPEGPASQNATPTNPLVLSMMLQDPAPSIYLGRPCHFYLDAVACYADLWTVGRYGSVVVDALCQAVEDLAAENQMPVALVGFSGGGALAVLVAGCAESVTHIVTINGNLDTKLWAEMRGFLPLIGSMNPIEFGLPDRVTQRIYFAGGEDAVVPPEISSAFEQAVPGRLVVKPQFTHTCCWVSAWESLLGEAFTGATPAQPR
jgi:hypothetical protein